MDALEHTAGALTNKVVALEEIVTGLAYKADTFQRQQVPRPALPPAATDLPVCGGRGTGSGGGGVEGLNGGWPA